MNIRFALVSTFLLMFVVQRNLAQFLPDSVDNYSYQREQYLDYLSNLDSVTINAEDGDIARFFRWDHYWEQRIGTDQKFTTYNDRIEATNNPSFKTDLFNNCINGDWKQLGPFDIPCKAWAGDAAGVGRINRVVFDPDYELNGIIYALTHGGSLYKSNDRGENWRDITMGKVDKVAVGDLAINPLNNQELSLVSG